MTYVAMNRNVLTLCFLQWLCIIITMIIFVKYIFNMPNGYNKMSKNLNNQTITRNKDDEYYVNSETCKVPRVNVFSDGLLSYYIRFKPLSCSHDDDLVTSKYHAASDRYILYLNKNATCSYREITRSGIGINADRAAKLSTNKVDLRNAYIVPMHIEGMLVKCFDRNGNRQMTAFAFVQSQNQSSYNDDEKPTDPDKPSVIMLGIDSLSRINLQRSMPQLYEYLKKPGWFELQGYNKVGDNTFPNLLAVLTGYSPEAAQRYYCDYRKVGCLNQLPFIWEDFKHAGYKTAYVEDNPMIGTFNSRLPGFKAIPVDFYPRPFFISIQKHLTFIKRFNRFYCIGRQHTLTYNYGYCYDFIERFINRKPIFGIFWANQFAASECESASAFDVATLKHLNRFADVGLYNKSIVIFFSDHGVRFGRMRALPEGFIDERSPALYIWLPQWFRHRYPQYAQALKDNRNRLTSNYDLHLTLKQILIIGGYSATTSQNLPECPLCQSLFATVPFNRTCTEAGIRNHYCTCHPTTPVPHTDVFHIMSLVMDAMNSYLALKKINDICTKLTLNRIKEAHRVWLLNSDDPNVLTYRLKYIVDQNDAEFEVTVQYRKTSNDIDVDVETISRLNAYYFDAVCVRDKIQKKYCLCRTQLKPCREKIVIY